MAVLGWHQHLAAATIVGGGGAASQRYQLVFIVQLKRDSANSFGWWLVHLYQCAVYLVSMALTHLYHTPLHHSTVKFSVRKDTSGSLTYLSLLV